MGRPWLAPPGSSLLVSVLLRPELPPERLGLAGAAVSVAALEACSAVAGFRPGLKWPNDLVADEGKLAGVLAETALPAVVVGIGVNVNWPAPALAAVPGASSLNHVTGRTVDREALLTAMLDSLSGVYGDWPTVAAEYRRSCTTVGRSVRAEVSGTTLTGTAVDLTDEGHLVIDAEGVRHVLSAADVAHLRSGG